MRIEESLGSRTLRLLLSVSSDKLRSLNKKHSNCNNLPVNGQAQIIKNFQ
jgi:hypothetical protein